jgi:hypothetical protein
MNESTFQFPLAVLAYAGSAQQKLFAAIGWGIIETGKRQLQRLTRHEIEEICNAQKLDAGKSFDGEKLIIAKLGTKFCGRGFQNAEYAWTVHDELDAFLESQRVAGRNVNLLTRLPASFVMELGWRGDGKARDIDSENPEWRIFCGLAAGNAVLGSKPYGIITRNRIRAGMLGYSSGKALFDDSGEMSLIGGELLAERQDGILEPISESQARTVLVNLVKRGFYHTYTPPTRGSLTYYSKFLTTEEIAWNLVKRELKKHKGTELQKLDAQLLALKSNSPLSGEPSLSGEASPHNEVSPHNVKVATPSPPVDHPIATRSPHNASLVMLPSNASHECLPVMHDRETLGSVVLQNGMKLVEAMHLVEEVLGPKEFFTNHSRWFNRAKEDHGKLIRVLNDTRNKVKEDGLDNPASWAETMWGEVFK